jgi:hypothetical protein
VSPATALTAHKIATTYLARRHRFDESNRESLNCRYYENNVEQDQS